MSMSVGDRIRAELAIDPAQLRRTFAPPDADGGAAVRRDMLASYRGPGQERVLAALERARLIDPVAAPLPADAVDGAAGSASTAPIDPVARLDPTAPRPPGIPAPQLAADVPTGFVDDALALLDHGDPATRLAVLVRAHDLGAATAAGPDAAAVLSMSLREMPVDRSAPALANAIEQVVGRAAVLANPATPDAAAASTGAPSGAADAVTPGAAPAAAAPTVVADIATPAVADPAVDGARRGAATLTHTGGPRLGMHAAIAEALRVLPRV